MISKKNGGEWGGEMSYFHFPANQNLLSHLPARYFRLLLFFPYMPSPVIGERGQGSGLLDWSSALQRGLETNGRDAILGLGGRGGAKGE